MGLFTYEQMQMHSEKLRAVLDSYDSWELIDTDILPKYIYRSGTPLISLKNLASTAGLDLSTKIATLPVDAFGTDSVIFVYDSNATISCESVSGGVKVSVNQGFYTDEFILLGKAIGDSVKLQHGKNSEVVNYTLS